MVDINKTFLKIFLKICPQSTDQTDILSPRVMELASSILNRFCVTGEGIKWLRILRSISSWSHSALCAMSWSGGNRIILLLSLVCGVFQAAANIRSLKLVNRSGNLILYYIKGEHQIKEKVKFG